MFKGLAATTCAIAFVTAGGTASARDHAPEPSRPSSRAETYQEIAKPIPNAQPFIRPLKRLYEPVGSGRLDRRRPSGQPA